MTSRAAVLQREGLLTALAAVTAYDAGLYGEVVEMAVDPAAAAVSFAGAVALASKLAAEVDRLGGDSKEFRDRVYGRAVGLTS